MTIFGSDVSHFDAPDTRLMFNDGVLFQTHKAGGDAADNELAGWWQLVRSLRPAVLLGAYWVLYPGTPAARADAFLARLDSQCPGWRDGPFILQVDCEKWNGDSSTVPNRNDIRAFCDRLVLKAPKLRPIVYAPKWVYGNTLAGLGYPLWASAYVNGTGWFGVLYPGDDSSKWASYSDQVPAILQYSSTASIGGQTTCDANAFRGTLKELTALVAPGWIEDDMGPIDPTDIGKIFSQDGTVATASNASDYAKNPKRSAGEALTNIEYHVRQLEATVATQGKGLLAAVQALASKDTVDEAALAAELAPAIVALLPADQGDVTVEKLTAALRALIVPAAE